MPATMDIRLPVTPEEHAKVAGKAGESGIAAYLRRLLGLPQRRRGRPAKPPAAADGGGGPRLGQRGKR